MVSGEGTAELENDGSDDVAVAWEIEVKDSENNSIRDSGYINVPANGSAMFREGAFVRATYMQAGAHTGTCRFKIHSQERSTDCTFTIFASERMPEALRNALAQKSEPR
jgi:hypothetical protein